MFKLLIKNPTMIESAQWNVGCPLRKVEKHFSPHNHSIPSLLYIVVSVRMPCPGLQFSGYYFKSWKTAMFSWI